LLSDAEFVALRLELQEERLRISQRIVGINGDENPIEPFQEFISFNNRATDWFIHGNDQSQRLIFETVASNLTLTGKILRH
jgi:hypothetical protein